MIYVILTAETIQDHICDLSLVGYPGKHLKFTMLGNSEKNTMLTQIVLDTKSPILANISSKVLLEDDRANFY